jgi:hypothetical protein
MVSAISDIVTLLSRSEAADKTELYAQLGLWLTYHPGQRTVSARAEVGRICTKAARSRAPRPAAGRSMRNSRSWTRWKSAVPRPDAGKRPDVRGLEAKAAAWQRALANRVGDGSVASGRDIGSHDGRHERWGGWSSAQDWPASWTRRLSSGQRQPSKWGTDRRIFKRRLLTDSDRRGTQIICSVLPVRPGRCGEHLSGLAARQPPVRDRGIRSKERGRAMARRAAVVLKAMKSNWCGAGMKVELDGYAGVAEARGVGEVFVAEHVELGDLDVGGRQPSTSRRRGPRRAPAPDGLRLVCAVRSVNQVRRVGMAHDLRAGEYPGMFLTRMVDGVEFALMSLALAVASVEVLGLLLCLPPNKIGRCGALSSRREASR